MRSCYREGEGVTKVIVVALLIITFLSFRVSSEPLFEVSATSQTESNPIGLAFDGSRVGNSFWEALGGYPFSVEWTYPTATKISSYSLSSGEYELKRMPTSWTLEGSGDGKEWLVVDQRESIADWQLSETRTFYIKDPRETDLLLSMVFTAHRRVPPREQ